TGTAAQNWWEIRRVYKIWVTCVPTNRPVIREAYPDRVFPHEDAKFDAVAEEVVRLYGQGRPVLIGTRSVEISAKLSERLRALGTERHEARRIDRQLAGRSGRQGDPGSCQFFLALDDELLEGLGPGRQESLRLRGVRGGSGPWEGYQPLFLKAQRRVERRHF